MTSTDISTQLTALAEQVRTQDNHITADPIFYVQQKDRQWGNEDSGDSYLWMDEDWNEVEGEMAALLDKADDEYDEEAMRGFNKQYYRDVYQNVQPFFSMEGAKHYIKINGHNLKEPRVYVDSAYRNAEWQLIRALLLNYNQPTV